MKYRVEFFTSKGQFGGYTGTREQVERFMAHSRALGDTIVKFGRV